MKWKQSDIWMKRIYMCFCIGLFTCLSNGFCWRKGILCLYIFNCTYCFNFVVKEHDSNGNSRVMHAQNFSFIFSLENVRCGDGLAYTLLLICVGKAAKRLLLSPQCTLHFSTLIFSLGSMHPAHGCSAQHCPKHCL